MSETPKALKPSMFKRIGSLLTDAQGNMRWQAAVLCVSVLVVVCCLVGSNVGEIVSIRQSLLHNHPKPNDITNARASLSNQPLRAHWDDVQGISCLILSEISKDSFDK